MQSEKMSGVLRRVPLFAGLSDKQLAWISDKGTEVNFPPGALIASQGDPVDGFYVILQGAVEWTRRVGGREVHAVTLEALAALEEEASAQAASLPSLGPLARNNLEDEVAGWLENRGLEDGWELAPAFADAGLSTGWLGEVEAAVPGKALTGVLEYLGAAVMTADLLAEAEASVGRISGLVEAVKSYSNIDRAPLVEVDIDEGIEQTLTVLGYELGPGIEVTREYDPKLPRITAYRGELNQVWTNLIDNAIDAVSGEAGENGQGRIGLRTTCEGDGVLVEVSDSGPGIPEELQARVFEPFYTTKGVGAGTVLGLDIAYRIVVGRHGGDIRIVSRPGDTRFQVRLPLQPGGGIGKPERSTEAEEEAPVR